MLNGTPRKTSASAGRAGRTAGRRRRRTGTSCGTARSAICGMSATFQARDDVPARVGVARGSPRRPARSGRRAAVGRRPGPPLVAVDRPEVAVLVGPLVPDRDAAVLQPLDVGVAAQEPQQLGERPSGCAPSWWSPAGSPRRGRSASGGRRRCGCRCRCGRPSPPPSSRIRWRRSRYCCTSDNVGARLVRVLMCRGWPDPAPGDMTES